MPDLLTGQGGCIRRTERIVLVEIDVSLQTDGSIVIIVNTLKTSDESGGITVIVIKYIYMSGLVDVDRNIQICRVQAVIDVVVVRHPELFRKVPV